MTKLLLKPVIVLFLFQLKIAFYSHFKRGNKNAWTQVGLRAVWKICNAKWRKLRLYPPLSHSVTKTAYSFQCDVTISFFSIIGDEEGKSNQTGLRTLKLETIQPQSSSCFLPHWRCSALVVKILEDYMWKCSFLAEMQ